MSDAQKLAQDADESARSFIGKIAPHVGIALDFDDTLVCSEWVAAGVTAELVSPFLIRAGHEPLTTEVVCRDYSGLNFIKQVALIEKKYGITVPEEVIALKERGNLDALAKHSLTLHGSEELLKFLIEFRLHAMVLTASGQKRVMVTAECTGLEPYLTIGNEPDDNRIPVLSGGEAKQWRGIDIPALAHKPAPDGYNFVAKALGLKAFEMVACEDSPPGIIAARDANYAKIAVISMSRRCAVIPDHAESMAEIVGDPEKTIVAQSSFRPVAEAMLELGLKNARAADVQDLPQELPPAVQALLDRRFTDKPCTRPVHNNGLVATTARTPARALTQ